MIRSLIRSWMKALNAKMKRAGSKGDFASIGCKALASEEVIVGSRIARRSRARVADVNAKQIIRPETRTNHARARLADLNAKHMIRLRRLAQTKNLESSLGAHNQN